MQTRLAVGKKTRFSGSAAQKTEVIALAEGFPRTERRGELGFSNLLDTNRDRRGGDPQKVRATTEERFGLRVHVDLPPRMGADSSYAIISSINLMEEVIAHGGRDTLYPKVNRGRARPRCEPPPLWFLFLDVRPNY